VHEGVARKIIALPAPPWSRVATLAAAGLARAFLSAALPKTFFVSLAKPPSTTFLCEASAGHLAQGRQSDCRRATAESKCPRGSRTEKAKRASVSQCGPSHRTYGFPAYGAHIGCVGPLYRAPAARLSRFDLGVRAASFLTRVYNRLVRPGLPAVLPVLRATGTPLNAAFDKLRPE
jgi:hypothetical protein